MMKRAMFSLMVLVLVVTACAPEVTPDAEEVEEPDAAAEPDDALTLTIDTGPPGINQLDPELHTIVEKWVTGNIAEHLIARDEELGFQPALATSWELAEDNVTWTLELRQGVAFTDGTPFDAEAVRANAERWLDPDTVSRTWRGEMQRAVASFEILSDYSVRFTLKSPEPGFLAMIAGWGTHIVSPTALETEDIATNLVGTGPFEIESFVPGERLTLVPNDDYWGSSPLVDSVVLLSIFEPSARTAALVTGEVDLSINVPPSQVSELQATPDVLVAEVESPGQRFFTLNTRRPPLDQAAVRQAINHALDMEAVQDVAYEGFARPFLGPINLLIYSRDPQVAGPGLVHDPDKARELLDQAGLADGFQLQLIYEEDPVLTRYAEVVQGQLQGVGIDLELVRLDEPTWRETWTSGDYDISMATTGNSYADPAVILRVFLSCDAEPNFTGYCNDTIEQLIVEYLATPDEQARNHILNDVSREFDADPNLAGGLGTIVVYAWRDHVEGVTYVPTIDVPFKDISLHN